VNSAGPGELAHQLLDKAEQVLSGSVAVSPTRRARVAALLARSALESIVEDLYGGRGSDVSTMSMRVILICLPVVTSDSVARQAAMAWYALSGCCHVHAYELSPTDREVRHWAAQVRSLALILGPPGSRRPRA